jgi:TPR repeat protein
VDPAKVAAQKSKSERDLLEWQKKRAEAGSDNAQYELGVRYLTGNGVDKDEKVGMEWLTKAAKSGNFQAKKKLEELKNEAGESKLGLSVPAVKSTPEPSADKAVSSPAK